MSGKNASGPKTNTERYLSEDIIKALKEAGLWNGRRWEYSSTQQGSIDPVTTVIYETNDMGFESPGRSSGYFSFSLTNHDEVSIAYGPTLTRAKHMFFPTLAAGQRWLTRDFQEWAKVSHELVKMGSTNPELREHIRPILNTLKKVNLRGHGQSGGSPKTPEDRKIADAIKKTLDRAGLWKPYRWEYFLRYQGDIDPITTRGYSTYDMDDYFSFSIEEGGRSHGEVVISHSGGEYEYFPNLTSALRWLSQNFQGM